MSSSKILRSYLDILNERGGGGRGAAVAKPAVQQKPVQPAVQQTPAQPAVQQKPVVPKPGQPANLQQTPKVQQKTKVGLQSVGKSLTGKAPSAVGQAVQGFNKISQGSAVTGMQSSALEPFIEPLQMILANPQLKQKFLALVAQAKQGTAKIDPTALQQQQQ